jgi:hypothetical protein
MKVQIVLAAILAIGTLMGVGALVSAVQKADHGTDHTTGAHTSSVWHEHQGLVPPAA